MFFTRKQTATSSRGPVAGDLPQASGPGPDDTSVVLDALGGILQAYARHTHDTQSLDADAGRARVEEWARHVTVGGPHPDRPDARPGALAGRDWRGLVHFIRDHRRAEHLFAGKTMGELRDTIWAIVATAHRVAQAEDASGRSVSEHLERVRAAVEGSDITIMRREALAAVEAVASELERRREDQRREFSALADRVRALGSQLEEARRESSVDPLTRLANRKAFEEFIEHTIALHMLSGEPASLLMIDMDQFKYANDTFGHPVGDAVLRIVGDCLSRVFLRRCDLVCRYGGDEFAVVLTETAEPRATALAQRAVSIVREARPPEQAPGLTLGLSVGVAELARGDSATSWVRRADAALYAAKRGGGNQVVTAM